MNWLRSAALFALFALTASLVPAAAPFHIAPPLPDEFRDYLTVRQATRTRVSMAAPTVATAQPGYLGVHLDIIDGKLVVASTEASSPAEKAGLRKGDVLKLVDGKAASDVAVIAELVRSGGPGAKLAFRVDREGKTQDVTVTLAATSRPLVNGPRLVLGVQIEQVTEGVRITTVTAGSSAEKAGLKSGDVVTAINGEKLAGKVMSDLFATKKAGDQVKLSVTRADKTMELTATLTPERTKGFGKGKGKGWDDRPSGLFKKAVYKLAIVPIEYPDQKHNPKIKNSDWEESLFSFNQYKKTSATGQKVHGSMNDYYYEQSCGKFQVTGKMFDWVTVKRKREEYAKETNKALLSEALDLIAARDGKTALDGYDGVFFLYAGGRVSTNRGGLYWPHKSFMRWQGRNVSYFICPEGGRTMDSISVITHEFGHMLGFPDLYARPEVPGQEGLGIWCTMAVGHGQTGRPLHLSAWCKVAIGWLDPVVIDPRVKQKLILSPVFGVSGECYKVLIRPDGSEYLLLENRTKKGFDRDLPAEGLLIWRVVDGRPVLEESHGIAGPAGPDVHRGSIPYPSGSNTSFTPFTTPSSRSLKGGGLPVHVTNIRKLPDGRIAFQIGYEYF